MKIRFRILKVDDHFRLELRISGQETLVKFNKNLNQCTMPRSTGTASRAVREGR